MQLNETVTARGSTFTFSGEFEPEFQSAVDAFIENYKVCLLYTSPSPRDS